MILVQTVLATIAMFRVALSMLTMACVTLAVSMNVPVKQDNHNILNDVTTKVIDVVEHFQENKKDSHNNDRDFDYYLRCLNLTKPSSFLESLKLCGNLKSQNDGLDRRQNRMWLHESIDIVEARGKKKNVYSSLVKLALGLKMVAFGLILPGVVALSMLHSWKAVTISLLALGLAFIIGLKNIIKATKENHQKVLLSPLPTNNDHHHFWRTLNVHHAPEPVVVEHDDHHDFSPHHIAYRKYDPIPHNWR